MKRKIKKSHMLEGEVQRKAISSPLRLEILGLFTDHAPLSVAEMAARMGRSVTGVHYHVRVLERSGLLKRSGERRAGRRSEALYLPVARMLMLKKSGSGGNAYDAETVIKTTAAAFRMAQRDVRTALGNPATRTDGPGRNLLVTRAHCRISKKDLAELNRRLRTIEQFLGDWQKQSRPAPDDVFVSLTLALSPLPDREDTS